MMSIPPPSTLPPAFPGGGKPGETANVKFEENLQNVFLKKKKTKKREKAGSCSGRVPSSESPPGIPYLPERFASGYRRRRSLWKVQGGGGEERDGFGFAESGAEEGGGALPGTSEDISLLIFLPPFRGDSGIRMKVSPSKTVGQIETDLRHLLSSLNSEDPQKDSEAVSFPPSLPPPLSPSELSQFRLRWVEDALPSSSLEGASSASGRKNPDLDFPPLESSRPIGAFNVRELCFCGEEEEGEEGEERRTDPLETAFSAPREGVYGSVLGERDTQPPPLPLPQKLSLPISRIPRSLPGFEEENRVELDRNSLPRNFQVGSQEEEEEGKEDPPLPPFPPLEDPEEAIFGVFPLRVVIDLAGSDFVYFPCSEGTSDEVQVIEGCFDPKARLKCLLRHLSAEKVLEKEGLLEGRYSLESRFEDGEIIPLELDTELGMLQRGEVYVVEHQNWAP